MIDIAKKLRSVLEKAAPELRKIPSARAAEKPRPGKWSKKEILGHLIDSAANNHQRFVRSVLQKNRLEIDGYAQNEWVEREGWQARDWAEIIDFWLLFNRQLAFLIETTPADALENEIVIGGKGPFSLRFVIEDYVEHLLHHLRAILPELGFESAFKNIYEN